jgi:hypothetical protein
VPFAKNYYADQLKDDEMDEHAVHVEERRNVYEISVWKAEVKRPIERPRCR